MSLFYNPSWMTNEDHMMLFLAKVPEPIKIKTWNDLVPYMNGEIAKLIEMEDQHVRPGRQPISSRMVEDLLHPDLLTWLPTDPSPALLAEQILTYPGYQNEINQLRRRIQAGKINPKPMSPDIVKDVYNERSLGSILELL